jgi:starch phosphorylase
MNPEREGPDTQSSHGPGWDRRDADHLYLVHERQVIPLFYDRDERGVPAGWVAMIKHAIQGLAWRFNAGHMVKEYVSRYYLPTVGAGHATSTSSV